MTSKNIPPNPTSSTLLLGPPRTWHFFTQSLKIFILHEHTLHMGIIILVKMICISFSHLLEHRFLFLYQYLYTSNIPLLGMKPNISQMPKTNWMSFVCVQEVSCISTHLSILPVNPIYQILTPHIDQSALSINTNRQQACFP